MGKRLIGRLGVITALVTAFALAGPAAGCGGGTPAPEPWPKPEPKRKVAPKPVPEPEPEPACESLEEECAAEATTLARLPNGITAFSPPLGWTYVQAPTETLIQLGAEGPVMVVTTYDVPKSAAKRVKARGELGKTLSKVAGVDPGRGFAALFFKSGAKQDHAGIEMTMWEHSGAKRAGGDGIMVVFEGSIGEQAMFGVAFVPESDTDSAKMILESLDTVIEVEPREDDGAAKDEDDDKDDDSKPSGKGDGK